MKVTAAAMNPAGEALTTRTKPATLKQRPPPKKNLLRSRTSRPRRPKVTKPEPLKARGSRSQPSAFFMMALVRSSDVFATFSGSCLQYSGLKSSMESAPR